APKMVVDCLNRLGRNEEAAEEVTKLIDPLARKAQERWDRQTATELALWLRCRARLREEDKDFRAALQDLDQSLRLSGRLCEEDGLRYAVMHAVSMMVRGRVLHRLGRVEDGLRELDRAVEVVAKGADPAWPWWGYWQAKILYVGAEILSGHGKTNAELEVCN